MAAFDHILLLFSFVFALALTHLLSRVGTLLLARKRVKFSALHALEIINAVGWVYANWLLLWDLHGIKNWDLLSITIWFAFATALGIATNTVFLKTSDPSLFLKANVGTVPDFAPPILALVVSARWAQWVAGVAILVLTIWWMIAFSGNLQ
jgi:hypothetical protein